MVSVQVSLFPVCHLIWINRIEIYRYIGQILKIHELAGEPVGETLPEEVY